MTDQTPGHVVILALGPSLDQYTAITKALGGRQRFCDEVWGVNAAAGVFQCDRIFHMDDVELQERRAQADPTGHVAGILGWLKAHPGPVYTSRVVHGYPGLVEYPLEDVINGVGYLYFNNTVSYALAFALWIGVKKVSLFGCDFTYPNSHKAEKGRACLEWWMGFATAKGMQCVPSGVSPLMDACEDGQPYGYDGLEIEVEVTADGWAHILRTPKDLPTAAEIEARYDHTRHPNPLVGEG